MKFSDGGGPVRAAESRVIRTAVSGDGLMCRLRADLGFQWQAKNPTRTKPSRYDRCAHNACSCQIAFRSRVGPKVLTIRLHHLFGAALLQPPDVRTPPVQLQQLGVRAVFDDAPELHHESLMRVDDVRKPVRDHECSLVACGAPQFFLNRTFVGRTERRCGLVEDQQQRVLQQRARNRDALLFAAREAPTCRNS